MKMQQKNAMKFTDMNAEDYTLYMYSCMCSWPASWQIGNPLRSKKYFFAL